MGGGRKAATRSQRPAAAPPLCGPSCARLKAATSIFFMAIATVNVWNRLNVATGRVAGEWKP